MKNFIGMRAIPRIEYHRPRELKEALKLLGEFKEGCKVIAGGTDLIPGLRTGRILLPEHFHIVDVSSIQELSYVTKDEDIIRIGATTRLSDIEMSPIMRKQVPMLADAVSHIGSLQIRNQGTIGGNLCNASPAADSAPPLLVLDAMVSVNSLANQRAIPLKEFFIGPRETSLAPDEMLTEVQIPIVRRAERSCFLKWGRRNAFTLSTVSVATLLRVKNGVFDDIRIALGAVAPIPIRASKTEEHQIGQKARQQVIDDGAKVVTTEVIPISDVRASAAYREDMSYMLTKRAIMSCLNGKG